MVESVKPATATAFLPKRLANEAESMMTTMVVAVPRVFEKMFSAAQQQSKAKNLGPIFARATEVAISYSKQRAKGSVGLLTKAEHALFDRLVY